MLDALRNHTPTPAIGVPVIVHPLPARGRHPCRGGRRARLDSADPGSAAPVPAVGVTASPALAATAMVRPRDERTGQFRAPAELARNSGRVLGAFGVVLPGPVRACGIEWLPEHGSPWGSPIGAYLAAEWSAEQE